MALSILGLICFSITLFATELVRRHSIHKGYVSVPRSTRWNTRSVPVGGGIAILLAMVFGLLWYGRIALAVPLVLMYVTGSLDDDHDFSPGEKILFQSFPILMSAALLDGPLWFLLFSIVWMFFLTNAINLSDNMDGLCSGLVSIMGIGMWMVFDEPLGIVIAASTIAFFLHNSKPARIFMGDCGSLPLGFILSFLCLEHMHTRIQLFQSAALLSVPIIDSCSTIFCRYLGGRSLFTGNIDHLSHKFARVAGEWVSLFVLLGLSIVGVSAAWLMKLDLFIGLQMIIAGLFFLSVSAAIAASANDQKSSPI